MTSYSRKEVINVCNEMSVLLTIALLEWSRDTGEPVLINGKPVVVIEVGPIPGVPQYKTTDGDFVTLLRSDDVQIGS